MSAVADRVKLIAVLRRDEGWRARPYRDSVGKLTIGCGRNLDDKGLNDSEISVLLNNDIDECVCDLITFPWFPGLDPVRQRAITNMRFNLGPTKFREFKRTIAALARQDYEKAAEHMLASQWAVQVKGRARRLAFMVKTGQEDER